MEIEELKQLAFTYLQIGDIEQAEQISNTILKTDTNDADIFYLLGLINTQKRNFDLAIDFLQKALKKNPSNAKAYCNLGNIYLKHDNLDEAISCYQEALGINPIIDNIYKNLAPILHQQGTFNETMENYHEDKQSSILIVVPAFNRNKITKLSLTQTIKYKKEYCHLQVYNDHSTEYDNSFLASYANEVIQLPHKMGIQRLRWYQLRRFLDTNYDLLYLTDNDVIHDPAYIKALEVLYHMGQHRFPVSLFQSIYHVGPNIILYYQDGIMLKKMAPGVSMFLDRKMVEKILSHLDIADKDLNSYDWDFKVCELLDLPWIIPELSFLEHYGGAGLHSDNYERDRALNPTQYLIERRKQILAYLLNDVEPQIIL